MNTRMRLNKRGLFICLIAVLMVGASGHPISINTNKIVARDPDLEEGFPVQSFATAGGFRGGPGIHTMVTNIDADPELEILATNLASGPLYAWNFDGSLASGWPPQRNLGATYPVGGNFFGDHLESEMIASLIYHSFRGYTGDGKSLPGWSPPVNLMPTLPAAVMDIDQDNLDEIFVNGYGLDTSGSQLPGWPVLADGDHVPAIADIDLDGDAEVITTNNSPKELRVYHHDGNLAAGFPVSANLNVQTYLAAGDVDGDGGIEIIFVGGGSTLYVYSAAGVLERSMVASGEIFYGSAPALADLNHDTVPEIIVQTNTALNIWYGNGSPYPGWPQQFNGSYWLGNYAPVVGDVNGDGNQEIVVGLQDAGSSYSGEIRIYNRSGSLLPNNPKEMDIGHGAAPAISDIDLDGRNEIIVIGNYWDGYSGLYDQLWVFDLGGPGAGSIEWGQFGGAANHQGVYPPVTTPPAAPFSQYPYALFIPAVSNRIPASHTGITGRVTFEEFGVPFQAVDLYRLEGNNMILVQNRSTDASGGFRFTAVPSLPAGASYYVTYSNPHPPGSNRISEFYSRRLDYYQDGPVGIGDIELQDVPLVSPADHVTVSIPAPFTWITRTANPGELYGIILVDPVSSQAYLSNPFFGTGGVNLLSLPPGFTTGQPYLWGVFILDADGALGFSSEMRTVTFSNTADPPAPKILSDPASAFIMLMDGRIQLIENREPVFWTRAEDWMLPSVQPDE